MQIVEQTGFGLRTAVMTLARKDSSVRFLLDPMIRLGSTEFFSKVHASCSHATSSSSKGFAAGEQP